MDANIIAKVTYLCVAVALSSTNNILRILLLNSFAVELQTRAGECWSAEPHVHLHTKTLFTAVIPLT